MRSGVPIAAVDVTQRFDYDLAGRLQKRRFDNIAGQTRSLDYTYWTRWRAGEKGSLCRSEPIEPAENRAFLRGRVQIAVMPNLAVILFSREMQAKHSTPQ